MKKEGVSMISKKTKKKKSEVSVRRRGKTQGGGGSNLKKKPQSSVMKRPKKDDEHKDDKENEKEKEKDKDKEKEEKKEEKNEGEETQMPNKEKDRPAPPYMMNPTDSQKTAYEKFAKEVFSVGVEGLLKEYTEQLKTYVGNYTQRVIFDQNQPRNRYKDVVCNDVTRVVIEDGKGSDYIHANHVRGEPLYNEFICTQGPMPATVVDFWRMVLHVKCYHIIMLCEVVEMGKQKCEQYWPPNKGEKLTFGEVTIEHLEQSCKDGHVTKTQLLVTMGSTAHIVRHHQWRTWPDRSIPKSSKATLRILQAVRGSPRPVIVHCSAGIGRTGTLVAAEMCLQRLLTTNHLCLLDVCKRLRDQRMHSVQVDMQYVYLAQVVLEYGKAMEFWNQPELKEEFAKFKGALDYLVNKPKEDGPKEVPTPTPVTQPVTLPFNQPSAEPPK